MAKPTKFVAACAQIQAAIERSTATGTGAHKRRAALEKEFALWATTFYATSSYPRLSKLRRVSWAQWDAELHWPAMQVACALRLMVKRGMSRAKATTATAVPKANLDLALKLVKNAGLSVEAVADKQSPDIEATVAGAAERVHVSLDARALEDMLLAAAEGYRVSPGKGFKYTEVYGLCFGTVRQRGLPSAEVECT